jgi:hypothetical protein
MSRVTFMVTGLGTQLLSAQARLPLLQSKDGSLVLESPLPEETALNDHLVWLWGMLKHERRKLKSFAASGAKLVCRCRRSKGSIYLLPNGAEMLHLLGAELHVEAM